MKNVGDLRAKISYSQRQTGSPIPLQNLKSPYLPPMTEANLRVIINIMSIKKPAGIDKIRFRDIPCNFDQLTHGLLAGAPEPGEGRGAVGACPLTKNCSDRPPPPSSPLSPLVRLLAGSQQKLQRDKRLPKHRERNLQFIIGFT